MVEVSERMYVDYDLPDYTLRVGTDGRRIQAPDAFRKWTIPSYALSDHLGILIYLMGTAQRDLDTACDRDNHLRTCYALHELEKSF